MKIGSLRKQAHVAARSRGHELYRFQHIAGSGGHRFRTKCVYCSAEVTVMDNPLPNEIDIAGEAVALNCIRKRFFSDHTHLTLETIKKFGDPAKGIHLGGSAAKTSPAFFGVSERDGGISDFHIAAFEAVTPRIFRLAEEGAIELMYYRNSPTCKVIAYRFVSDQFYNNHAGELVQLGSTLARGCWEPFGSDPYNKNIFETYMKEEPANGE